MDQQPFYGADENEIAYRVNFDLSISCVSINGHELSRLHPKADISDFFEYIHSHPSVLITTEDIKNEIKIELKKGLDDTLRDIGFRGILARLFFTKMTNDAVVFRNPVFHKDLKELDIDYIETWKLLHTPKRKGAISVTQ